MKQALFFVPPVLRGFHLCRFFPYPGPEAGLGRSFTAIAHEKC